MELDSSFIDDIIKKIADINAEEKKKYCVTYMPADESMSILENGHQKDNYAIKQSLALYSRMKLDKQFKTYKKTGDLNSFETPELKKFEPYSSDGSEYCKPWGKLDKQQKINRLMDYVNRLKEQMSLSNGEIVKLRSLLISAVNERKITRKSDVEYCETSGSILKIPGLKHNKQTKHFYIGTDSSDVNITKITSSGVSPVKKLDLAALKKHGPGINHIQSKIKKKVVAAETVVEKATVFEETSAKTPNLKENNARNATKIDLNKNLIKKKTMVIVKKKK